MSKEQPKPESFPTRRDVILTIGGLVAIIFNQPKGTQRK